MPKHKPIKFKNTLEAGMVERIKELMRENKTAKTAKNAALALAAVGGILTLGVTAPGILGVLGKMVQADKKRKYEEYRSLWRNFQYLKQKNCFEFAEEKDGYLVYRLTAKGREFTQKMIFEELGIKIPEEWDGYWRLVLFDIPEKYKKARMALQEKLKEIGFYQCQKSVWIHPFPCVEEVEFLKDTLGVKPFVKIFLVKEMTDGKVLFNFRHLLKDIINK